MTQGQDLVSLRNLVDGGFAELLREFTGTFAEYDTMPAQGYSGTRVELRFKDIDNVVAAPGEVYAMPTYTINNGLSNSKKSKWGYLAESIGALIAPEEDIKDCIGKVMKMIYCDGEDGRPDPKPIWNKEADIAKFPDKIVPTALWICTEIDGTSAPGKDTGIPPAEWAEQNLIGKSRAEFNKWAFADPMVRKDTGLQRSITDKSFINSLLQLGRVTEDGDGIFQVGKK